jgi:GNAT superfamily N-acetyltransferase
MTAKIEIREATERDIDRIVELQLRMAFETESLELDRGIVTKGVSTVLADPTKGLYYVAARADEIVGVMLTIPEWSDWRNAAVIWIHSLYVVPQARGKGLFKQMYLALKERVLSRPDLAGLRLFVDKNNQAAQNVYERLGMDKDHYELYEWLK